MFVYITSQSHKNSVLIQPIKTLKGGIWIISFLYQSTIYNRYCTGQLKLGARSSVVIWLASAFHSCLRHSCNALANQITTLLPPLVPIYSVINICYITTIGRLVDESWLSYGWSHCIFSIGGAASTRENHKLGHWVVGYHWNTWGARSNNRQLCF